jgi:hypothetical protein
MKIDQKSFFGRIFDSLGKSDLENSNFAKILTFDNVYPRYGPSKFENDQKSEEMDQKSFFDFFVFLGNSTTENTNFNLILMILWSISEIRVPENAKKDQNWPKMEQSAKKKKKSAYIL